MAKRQWHLQEKAREDIIGKTKENGYQAGKSGENLEKNQPRYSQNIKTLTEH